MNKSILIALLAINALCFTKKTNSSFKLIKGFELTKNSSYSGKPLEPIYFVKCKDLGKNILRNFQVIKTNQKLKDFFMSEFVLCEIAVNNKKLFYPFAWENSKIKEKDIETDCINIIDKKIKPIEVE